MSDEIKVGYPDPDETYVPNSSGNPSLVRGFRCIEDVIRFSGGDMNFVMEGNTVVYPNSPLPGKDFVPNCYVEIESEHHA